MEHKHVSTAIDAPPLKANGSIPRITWNDADLESALIRCQETHVGKGACFDVEYLNARFEYHRLLVRRGLLSHNLAEKRPA